MKSEDKQLFLICSPIVLLFGTIGMMSTWGAYQVDLTNKRVAPMVENIMVQCRGLEEAPIRKRLTIDAIEAVGSKEKIPCSKLVLKMLNASMAETSLAAKDLNDI